jgi:Yip1 domain
MDRASIVTRVKQILTTPKTEWPLIAAEPATVRSLYIDYILWLAAIPAVAGFIRGSLIGYGIAGMTIRTPIITGLIAAIVSYGIQLLVVYLVSLIVNALAPTFEGQQSPVQALKVVGYGWTAAWVAGVFVILPWIGWIVVLAGAVYSIYLLYLGLSPVMKNPEHKSPGYAALAVVIAIVLSWVLGLLLAMAIGGGTLAGVAAMSAAHPG